MAKIIDITEKLNFEAKPKLKVKDVEIEVNDSAVTMLKILPKLSEGATPATLNSLCENLFSEHDREKIEALSLNFTDFSTLVMEAVQLVTGDDDKGETPTPATI